MNALEPLLDFLETEDRFDELVGKTAHLRAGQSRAVLLNTSLRSFVAAALFRRLRRPILVVTASSDEAFEFHNDVRNYLQPEQVYHLPDAEVLPFERLSPNPEIVGKRMEVFDLLKRNEPIVAVTSVRTCLRKLPPREFLLEPLRLSTGQTQHFDVLLQYLVEAGYERTPLVEGKGQFSVRGGIIDIFSPNSFHPVRVEFLGDTIDSLREFALSSQSSISTLQEASIFPCREVYLKKDAVQRALRILEREPASDETKQDLENMEHKNYFNGIEFYLPFFYSSLSSLFDYLPRQALVILNETKRLHDTAETFLQQCGRFFQERLHFKSVRADVSSYYVAYEELTAAEVPRLDFYSVQAEGTAGGVVFESLPVNPFLGKLERLRQFIDSELFSSDNGLTTFFVLKDGTLQRMSEIFREWGYDARVPQDGFSLPGKINLLKGDLSQGFVVPAARLCVIAEADIFGQKRKARLERQTKDTVASLQLSDLKVGDYVVHKNYGIGRYGGIVQREIDNAVRDYILLAYAGKDKLYIPLDQINKVFKYHGPSGETPKLSKLGSGNWTRTTRRVKKALRELAFDLLDLYAHRRQARGFSFSADTPWQRELEETFAFEETPDQARTIREVKRDMESTKPMDRLVCGDVGYGKTEVAIRAAFKAVLDGKQVMFVAPTTILAQQHNATFAERFAPFPVFVEMLSRFRSGAEQRKIIEKFMNGDIDIVIGTHRLFQKDILPKDLGLVIVDEEQRFGVGHKEYLKEFKKSVDVLTLSATPIPRTLQMSLSGLRDLSLIDTPPEDRYPILTYVGAYEKDLCRQAIRRELEREGQVYYVHNRVETIERVLRKVKQLVPEARVGLAHGQMKEKDLEKIMLDFLAKRYDVLVSTTIIESGIDIPSVNTIIVEAAENLGLSQLYQLRGRVGRSDHRAYAYFFYSPGKLLSNQAVERLQTIAEFTGLGSGLKVALRDLEIRGAGNLLGQEQHGHLAAVGFELYCELLEETVREIEGRHQPTEREVTIDVPEEAYLPPSYIPEEFLRIETYREIAAITSADEARMLEKRLRDRYGPLPQPAQSVMTAARLKIMAKSVGVTEVRFRNGRVVLEGVALTDPDLSLLQGKYETARYKPHSKTLTLSRGSSEGIFSFLSALFDDIILLVKRARTHSKLVN